MEQIKDGTIAPLCPPKGPLCSALACLREADAEADTEKKKNKIIYFLGV